MDTTPHKAREIEALTFIVTDSAPASAARRKRWSRLLDWMRARREARRRRAPLVAR
ncbi:MAG TPA: hypothetical protein VGR80_08400 [Steroidobacteraceae bacterium]|nr:hypothetical protein [Steroidobacteraceae bacterium]